MFKFLIELLKNVQVYYKTRHKLTCIVPGLGYF